MNNQSNLQQPEADALAACEAEPIRTPGTIQSHGALLATDLELSRITHLSENIADYVPKRASELLGAGLDAVLSPSDEHTLRNALSVSDIENRREFLGNLKLSARESFGAVHVRNNRVIVELSPGAQATGPASYGLERLRWIMSRQHEQTPLLEALDGMVRNLRAISGFDRVMAYRFRPDGSGQVVAEARALAAESYLDLRFPKFDIPQIARNICLEQPVRFLSDINATPVPILALDPDEAPLDLTLAEVRGVSPVHVQYLRNMGVAASLVLPIVIDGELWGLFSCHHSTPMSATIEATMTYDLVGRIFNTSISNILRAERSEQIAKCTALTQNLTRSTNASPRSLFSAASWDSFAGETMRLLQADGLMLVHGAQHHSAGLSLPVADLVPLKDRLFPQLHGTIQSAHDLLREDAATAPIAGAMWLGIDLQDDTTCGLWLFRAEENEVIQWAGTPEKDIEVTAGQTRLHPRSSFRAYRAESKGCSKAWEPRDLVLADAMRTALRHAIDVQQERVASDMSLGLMVQELNHRVRNTISLVRSLARSSATGQHDVSEFTQALEVRLLALASAHELLVSSDFSGLSLTSIVERELKPFDAVQATVSGPSIRLSSAASTIMALVLHELATNAVKHGALSSSGGCVSVVWRVTDDHLVIDWTEKCDFNVNSPEKEGFGTFLIEQGLEHQLDGASHMGFREDGLSVQLKIPGAQFTLDENQQKTAVAAGSQRAPELKPQSLGTLLVLEDDFLIAAEHRTFLLERGAETVLLANSNAKALEKIASARPDCAIIDVNLGKEDSYPTAALLAEKKVPFVILSGYANETPWLSEFPETIVLKKPVDAADLVSAVQQVLK